MGICSSSALKITVFDPDNKKKAYTCSMKKLRTFQTVGDVLSFANIELKPFDRLYCQSFSGLEEVSLHSQFQIRNIVVKSSAHTIRYKILMEQRY